MRKSKTLFSLGLVLSFWALFVINFNHPIYALATSVKLKEGTPVILNLEKTINSESVNVGDTIDLTVTRDVEVDGKIVISTGTHARGEVVSVENKGAIGKPGKVMISVKQVTAVDGTSVPLRASLTQEGKGKETTAVLVGVLLCILGLLLIKGHDAVIPAGTEIKAYVDYGVDIKI